jgi:hypothetical protein
VKGFPEAAIRRLRPKYEIAQRADVIEPVNAHIASPLIVLLLSTPDGKTQTRSFGFSPRVFKTILSSSRLTLD